MLSRWTALVLLPVFIHCLAEEPAVAPEPGESADVAVGPELSEPAGVVEILDESAYELLSDTVTPIIRARGFSWSEGPVWIDEGGFLVFSDVPMNTAYKYVPGAGTSVYLKPSGSSGYLGGGSSQGSNGLLLDNDGRLVLMQHGDRRVAAMDAPLDAPAERFITMADRYDGKRLNSPNDAVYRSDGSLFFTDPPYGLDGIMDDESKELPFQGVYRLNSNGELALADGSLSFPNGIGLSPDEATLYVAVSDPAHAAWYAWDIEDDGALANKRVFFDATEWANMEDQHGLPDGMAVHSSGAVFATGPGGVWVFSAAGEPIARILTGRATANCTLTADEKTLYLTANDTLMSISLVSPGSTQ